MWLALKGDLEYFRPWLLGGLGMGVGIIAIVTVVFLAVGDQGPPLHVAASLRLIFLVGAPGIVGFIAQALRSEERRASLYLAGPLTPRQLAGAMVILPAILYGIGLIAGGLVLGVESMIIGQFELHRMQMAGFVGAQLLVYAQLGLLVQEAKAARDQGRGRGAAAGWSAFAVTVLLLAVLYLALARQLVSWTPVILSHLVVAAVAGVTTVGLYAGRTDFTR